MQATHEHTATDQAVKEAAATLADYNECDINKDFLLAGCAIVTADNGHGAWHTFLVEKVEGEWQGKPQTTYFVKVFQGSENSNPRHYRYVGILVPDKGYLRFTKKSPEGFLQTQAGKAWRWLTDCLWGRTSLAKFPGASIHHEGYCCDCGRLLTTAESIRLGRGPVCRGKANKAKKEWDPIGDDEGPDAPA